jgi:hypothetical protein
MAGSGNSMGLAVLEQTVGAVLVLLTLVDVLLTILYARVGKQGLSRLGAGFTTQIVARSTWATLRTLARWFPGARGGLMSFSGPLSMLMLITFWVVVLVLGSAMEIQPLLGTSVRISGAATPTDFTSALFAAGMSLSITGSGNFDPQTGGARMLYLANSAIGTSTVSLVITYLMRVYSGLRERNSLALTLQLLCNETKDAADLLARLGTQGKFEAGYNVVASVAQGVTSLEEAHHFYPVLFYFHTTDPRHSLSRLLHLCLDLVALVRACLPDDSLAWLKTSAAVTQLQRATMLLLDTLHGAFVPDRLRDAPVHDRHDAWRRRYQHALARLASSGVPITAHHPQGEQTYLALRDEWDARLRDIAKYLGDADDMLDEHGDGR